MNDEEKAPHVFITDTAVRIVRLGTFPEPETRVILLAFHAHSGDRGYPYRPELHATAEQARTIADLLLQAAERIDPQGGRHSPPAPQ